MQIYVSATAGIGGNGTKEYPFQKINEAAQVARSGDEVIVAPGIYRERVNPKQGGVTYRSAQPLGAVITGAEQVKEWQHHSGNVWVARISNEIFGEFNPYTTPLFGDWYFTVKKLCLGEVYLNGKAMYESETLKEIENPEKDFQSWEPEATVYRWFTEQDGDYTVVYANFQGVDPTQENVEINVRKHCFWSPQKGLNDITLSGFAVRQAATQWAPPTTYQEGMIGPNWAKGWIFEDLEVSDSRCVGVSLGKYLQPNNENRWVKKFYKDGTQSEREAICQAQYEGWTKENIGSHIVRRCHIFNCGQAGIAGHLGAVFSTIEDNHIHHINHRQDLIGVENAGVKIHAPIDLIFRRNIIHHCTRGLWLDWQAQGTRVTENLFHSNVPPIGTKIPYHFQVGEDLYVEVSHGPTLIDNNVFLSDFAARLSTQGLAFVHNYIAGSFTQVGKGTDNGENVPRYTPYHVPHQTEVAGWMTFMHGDARFYNNVFVQQPMREDFKELPDTNLVCGTIPYSGYPTVEEYFKAFDLDPTNWGNFFGTDRFYGKLPVAASGNMYFNGAKPFEGEENCCVSSQNIDVLSLQKLLPKIHTQTITTEILGEALQPEQKFENADGTPIIFNKNTQPGPLQEVISWTIKNL